jgi:hypothetical protein
MAEGSLTFMSVYLFLNFSKIVPESWACRLYVLTVLVQTAIDLGIEGDILIRINQVRILGSFLPQDPTNFPKAQGGNVFLADNSMGSRKMPVYLSIFALAQYVSVQPCGIWHSQCFI